MMQVKSFGSVRVFEPERERVIQAIDTLKNHLATFSEVSAVYLIGSYYRGDYGPFSDVDVVVIIRETADRVLDRSTKYLPAQFPVPLDLFVYTLDEVHRMEESNHPFWRHIREKHIVLFERPV